MILSRIVVFEKGYPGKENSDMGPQEMLDRAEVKNKWMLTPMKNFTARLWRTPLTAVIFQYFLPKRNPCFALIGAVYGVVWHLV